METDEFIDTCAEDLSEEQEAAFRELTPLLLEPGSGKYKLEGYAGTGKTYLAGRICQVLLAEDVPVVAAAPTHRATAELRNAINDAIGTGFEEVPTCTLPALLGLQLKGDGKGDYKLVPEGEGRLPEQGVVICDEGSMVGEETMEFVEKSREGVRWLFLGDPAQLPPVGEDPSRVFDLPGASLTNIVRQKAGNPIIEFTRRIREGLPHLQDRHLRYEGDAGIAVTRSSKAFLDSAIRTFSSETFDDDPYTARLLAYRNAVVDEYNRKIRDAIFDPDADEFIEGEWLVAQESWVPESMPVIINSELMKVHGALRETDNLALAGPWKIWRLEVQPEGRPEREIKVLCREDAKKYNRALQKHKKNAIKAMDEKDRNVASDEWKKFYQLKEQYAQVSYGYATTVHKSQGGTFESVFVDYRDLHRSREPDRTALKYVAGTRPRKRLALLV